MGWCYIGRYVQPKYVIYLASTGADASILELDLKRSDVAGSLPYEER
jgi:hypothetical protein